MGFAERNAGSKGESSRGRKLSIANLGGKVEPHEAVKESTSRSETPSSNAERSGRGQAAQQCAERARNATRPPE